MLMTKVQRPAITKGFSAIRQNEPNRDDGSRERCPTVIMPRFSRICAAALVRTVNKIRGKVLITGVLSSFGWDQHPLGGPQRRCPAWSGGADETRFMSRFLRHHPAVERGAEARIDMRRKVRPLGIVAPELCWRHAAILGGIDATGRGHGDAVETVEQGKRSRAPIG